MDNDLAMRDVSAAWERQVHEALRPVPAPDGFEARVLQRMSIAERGRQGGRWTLSRCLDWAIGRFPMSSDLRVAAALSVLALSVSGAIGGYAVHQERRAGEAQRQLQVAAEVTQRTLDRVSVRLYAVPSGRYNRILQEQLKGE